MSVWVVKVGGILLSVLLFLVVAFGTLDGAYHYGMSVTDEELQSRRSLATQAANSPGAWLKLRSARRSRPSNDQSTGRCKNSCTAAAIAAASRIAPVLANVLSALIKELNTWQ